MGSAVGKMVRVLPENVARPLEALRHVAARRTDPDPPHPETTATLVRASADQRRVRIGYALGPHRERTLQVDPWAVVVRHGRWYVLGWSHAADARRLYRIDRVRSVEVLDDPFTPPADLEPFRALEEQLSQGWQYPVEVEIDAPLEEVRRWLPRSLGRTEAIDERADPADRHHGEPGLVRHRDRRDPGDVHRRGRPRDPGRRGPAGEASGGFSRVVERVPSLRRFRDWR